MRKLLIMRGPSGSGKSTLIEKLGLRQHSLSMDSIRLMVASPEMSHTGTMMVSQTQNDRIAELFKKFIEERMRRAETLVLDAMFTGARDFTFCQEKAYEYGYDVRVMDMSSIPNAIVRARNSARPETQRLSDAAMDRIEEKFKLPFSVELPVINWSEDGSYEKVLSEWIDNTHLDLSGYKQVVFIGDIQGCATPLFGEKGLLAEGFDPDTAYFFLGDFLDRGPENGQVMRWLIDNAMPRSNVFFVFGNHEQHLLRMGTGQAPNSQEFAKHTLSQLIEAGVTQAEARALVERCVEGVTIQWNDTKVLVTHAGLPNVPSRLSLMSTQQLTHGTGNWEDPVDAQFERNAPPGWWQVHGHRNYGRQPVIASSCSINLEDAVEGGGHLRAVRLDSNGWTPIEIENNTFIPWRERRRYRKDWWPTWMDEPNNSKLPSQTLELMREHPGVMEKASISHPHIASLNFTKEVFQEKQWDEVVVKARGMFFDKDTLEIVARGYDKFFNLGEREETTFDALEQTLQFPVSVFVKENGYLGNVGYDARNNKLFVATKSTPDGDYSKWFREILDLQLPGGKQEVLRRFLRDFEASAVFEVIDPVRDPHMIEYPAPKLVLLDVFHRAADNRRLPYEDLKNLAGSLGVEVKRRAMEFKDMASLRGFLANNQENLAWRYKGEAIEGFVLEDKKGYMTKIKLPDYSFWKRMRTTKDRIAKLKEQREELVSRPNQNRAAGALADVDARLLKAFNHDRHPLAQAFAKWCQEQSVERLQAGSIIALRTAFESEVDQDPSWRATPWQAFPDQEKPKFQRQYRAPR